MLNYLFYLVSLLLNYKSNYFTNILSDGIDSPVPVFDIFYNIYIHFFSNYESVILFHHPYLPDLFLTITMILTYPYNLSDEFIYMHTILLLIRFLCVVATSNYCSPRYAFKNDTRGYINNLHSDLMISGHAMYMMLSLLFIFDNHGIIYSLFSSVLIFTGIITNLLVGDHYTSDIILGISLALLMYF